MGDPWTTPILLIPMPEDRFWEKIRLIMREEIQMFQNWQPPENVNQYQTAGLTYKPLLKMTDVCNLLQISRATIYEWIKHGKLKPTRFDQEFIFCGMIYSIY
jgi:hypothetical protein